MYIPETKKLMTSAVMVIRPLGIPTAFFDLTFQFQASVETKSPCFHWLERPCCHVPKPLIPLQASHLAAAAWLMCQPCANVPEGSADMAFTF